jgi:putative addiction module CopG family antidote
MHMTIHLPEDLERYVQSEVQRGRFASEEAAITEAVRLLRQLKQQTEASAPTTPITEQEFERKMMQSGFLGSVPLHPPAAPRDFQPIAIEGEPLSETIIRERR